MSANKLCKRYQKRHQTAFWHLFTVGIFFILFAFVAYGTDRWFSNCANQYRSGFLAQSYVTTVHICSKYQHHSLILIYTWTNQFTWLLYMVQCPRKFIEIEIRNTMMTYSSSWKIMWEKCWWRWFFCEIPWSRSKLNAIQNY